MILEFRSAPLAWLTLGELLLAVVAGVGVLLLPVEYQVPWWSAAGKVSDLAWGLLATLPLLAIAEFILISRWEPLKKLTRFVLDQIAPLFADASPAQMVCVAAAAGFSEELLFRGLIQQLPQVWVRGALGVVAGVAVSALMFGLAHAMTRCYFLLATLIGLYFSAVTILSGSLVAAMLAHGAYDLVAIVMILRASRRP